MNELETQSRTSARSAISRFALRFGAEQPEESAHLKLARLCATALVLTPELVSYLRTRFLQGQVPWVAEADLLLSELCEEVGFEQYAMRADVQAELLGDMRHSDPRVLEDVGRLVGAYLDRLARSDPFVDEFEIRTQQWAAYAFVPSERPGVAAALERTIRDALDALRSEGLGDHAAAMARLGRAINVARQRQHELEAHGEAHRLAEEITKRVALGGWTSLLQLGPEPKPTEPDLPVKRVNFLVVGPSEGSPDDPNADRDARRLAKALAFVGFQGALIGGITMSTALDEIKGALSSAGPDTLIVLVLPTASRSVKEATFGFASQSDHGQAIVATKVDQQVTTGFFRRLSRVQSVCAAESLSLSRLPNMLVYPLIQTLSSFPAGATSVTFGQLYGTFSALIEQLVGSPPEPFRGEDVAIPISYPEGPTGWRGRSILWGTSSRFAGTGRPDDVSIIERLRDLGAAVWVCDPGRGIVRSCRWDAVVLAGTPALDQEVEIQIPVVQLLDLEADPQSESTVPFVRSAEELIEWLEHALGISVPESTGPRVLVAGTGTIELPDETYLVAEVLGRSLADAGYRLIGGGWPGVDNVVGQEFVWRLRELDRAISGQLQHVVPENSTPDLWLSPEMAGAGERDAAGDWHEAIRRGVQVADAVVLVGGKGGTFEVYEQARRLGKPVIPIAATGGDARFAYGHLGLISSLDALTSEAWRTLARPILSRTDAEVAVQAALDLVARLTPAPIPRSPEESIRHGGARVHSLVSFPDGTFASAGGDSIIRIWSSDGSFIRTLEGHWDWVLTLAALPDGRLASGSADGTIRIWNLHGWQEAQMGTEDGGYVRGICVLPGGTLVTESDDPWIRAWSPDGQSLWRFEIGPSPVHALCALRDGGYATGDTEGRIFIWNSMTELTHEPRIGWKEHQGRVLALCALSDGRLVSSAEDGSVRVWNGDGSHEVLFQFERCQVALSCLPDGRLITGDVDGMIRIWTSNGRLARELFAERSPVNTFCSLPNGRLASGNDYGNIHVWSVAVSG
jgi:hypothetical protein